jgi:predicted Fe-Mo cluster-binding NifX family protein
VDESGVGCVALRIAFPTLAPGGLDSLVADRFGRAEKFTIVDVDDQGKVVNVEVHDNPGFQAGSGAGVKASQKLGDLHVNVYAGPAPGPNAYMALQYLGIKIVTVTGVKVREAIDYVLKALKELNK